MTQVADLSEYEIITLLKNKLPQSSNIDLGIGDDAAVLAIPSKKLVTSTDLLVENQDFRLSWQGNSGFKQGFKAFVQNAADIYAMGAKPTAMLLSLALPKTTEINYLEDLASGINAAAKYYGCDNFSVIGGDLSSSTELAISITIFGELVGKKPITRTGAEVEDIVAINGIPGLAAAALATLEGKLVAQNNDFINYQLQPKPALNNMSTKAHAMIDTSDGLLKDAKRIVNASQVAIKLDSLAFDEYLPKFTSALEISEAQALDFMLHGGEDHNLLATFAADEIPKEFHQIGKVVSGNGIYLDDKAIAEKGWEHFLSR
ncbi:MAG: thiamine-phosphate kinase [Micrococcaceae bacterium]